MTWFYTTGSHYKIHPILDNKDVSKQILNSESHLKKAKDGRGNGTPLIETSILRNLVGHWGGGGRGKWEVAYIGSGPV